MELFRELLIEIRKILGRFDFTKRKFIRNKRQINRRVIRSLKRELKNKRIGNNRME
jgi:hypothetical protein